MHIKKGTKIKVTKAFDSNGLVHFSAPFTGSFKCTIPVGALFVVPYEPAVEADGFYVEPENESDFLPFIAQEDREHPLYGGYSFVFMRSQFGDNIEVVS